jgi:hypothetical protein
MPAFSRFYGRTGEHAAELKLGLSRLPSDFTATICGICEGRGEYRQLYNAGCGGGLYHSTGGCDYCDGFGLVQGHRPAPSSVVRQVITAAHIAIGA